MCSRSVSSGVWMTLSAGAHALLGVENIRGADALEVPAVRDLLDVGGMGRSGWYTLFAVCNCRHPVEQHHTQMIPRFVLAYILALPFIVPLVTSSLEDACDSKVVVRMKTSGPGPLQVFYDTGAGFSEALSARVPTQSSELVQEFSLPIPLCDTRALRLAPGTGPGVYTIESVAIRQTTIQHQIDLPLDQLMPLQQLSVIERSSHGLVVQAPSGSNDPILLYAPAVPLTRSLHTPLVSTLFRVALVWVAMTAMVWLLERKFPVNAAALDQRLAAWSAWIHARPRTALLVVSLVASVLAMYPIVFFGRSLVSPNNHGLMMLYDEAPFVYGSLDTEIEDVRGSDVVTMAQSVPHSAIERRALSHGEWPLWNRYSALGRPLWGQALTFLLDPLHWIVLVVPDLALGWDLKFIVHRIVFAFGIGLTALAITGSLPASSVAVLGASFGGVYAHLLNHPTIFSLTYAPCVLLAWLLLARADDRGGRAKAGALLAVTCFFALVAGSPKDSVATLVAMSTVGALTIVLSRKSRLDLRQKVLTAALATVAFIFLSAPHWLIFLDTLKQSVTIYDGSYVQVAGLRHAENLFLSPLVYGDVSTGLHPLALVLTISAVVGIRRLWNHPAGLSTAIVTAALLAVAFGAIPTQWLLKIPFVRQIGHIDNTCLTAALPLLLILSAIGAEQLLAPGRRHATAVTVLTVIGAVLLLTGLATIGSLADPRSAVVLMLLPIAIALPACWAGMQNENARGIALVATLLSAIVLVLPSGFHLQTGIEPLDQLLIQPRRRTALDNVSPAVDAIHRASSKPARAVGVIYTLFSGTQALYDLESIGGADPLELHAYRDLQDTAGTFRQFYWLTLVPATDFERLSSYLDMINVEFVLGRSNPLRGLIELPSRQGDRLKAFHRNTAWPRAFFVDGVSTYTDTAELLQQVKDRGQAFAAVQHNDLKALHATEHFRTPSRVVVPAENYHLTVNSTSFRVTTQGPGVAVVGESYLANDFRATLNGKPVDYFRVNQVFKAIAIPGAGAWDVRFEYRPARWNLSLGLSGVGILMLAGLGFFERIDSSRRRSKP
jgi:hypothetical protein